MIDATIGLPALALCMGLEDRSVVRMFGPTGKPTAAVGISMTLLMDTFVNVAMVVGETPE